MNAAIEVNHWATALMLVAAIAAALIMFWRATETPTAAHRRRKRRALRKARLHDPGLRARRVRAQMITERARKARERSEQDPHTHP